MAEEIDLSPAEEAALERAWARVGPLLAPGRTAAPFALAGPDLSGLGDLLNLTRQEVLDALFDAALDSFDLALPDAGFYSPDQPRDELGRWTEGYGTSERPGFTPAQHRQRRQAAADAVRAFARGQGPATEAEATLLAGHLARLTVAGLHALKAEHGLRGSAPNKAALVAKLAGRFRAHRERNFPESVSTGVDKGAGGPHNTPVGQTTPTGVQAVNPPAKEPWQMTRDEVLAALPPDAPPPARWDAESAHWDAIRARLDAGLSVAPGSLAGHPQKHAAYLVARAINPERVPEYRLRPPELPDSVTVRSGRKDVTLRVAPVSTEAHAEGGGAFVLRRAQLRDGSFVDYVPGSVVTAGGVPHVVTRAGRPRVHRHDGEAQGYYQDVTARPLTAGERAGYDRLVAAAEARKLWDHLRDQNSWWRTPEEAEAELARYRAALARARGE